MNFFTECNALNVASNNNWASSKEKQEAPSNNPVNVKGSKHLCIETSPIASAARIKVVAKRKKRQNWSKVEDDLLIKLLRGYEFHELKWPQIAVQLNATFESSRTGKQCRERWLNHLRPDIKKGNWTSDEEFMIEYFFNTFGPKWSTMAKLMKKRTDNDIKNKWNSMKRIEKAGRKRQKVLIKDNRGDVSEVATEHENHQVATTRWSTMKAATIPERQISGKSILNSKRSPERLITPTVTDGGCAENSPIQKMYWEAV